MGDSRRRWIELGEWAVALLLFGCTAGPAAPASNRFIEDLDQNPVGVEQGSYSPELTVRVPEPVTSKEQASAAIDAFFRQHHDMAMRREDFGAVQEGRHVYYVKYENPVGFAIVYVIKQTRSVQFFSPR